MTSVYKYTDTSPQIVRVCICVFVCVYKVYTITVHCAPFLRLYIVPNMHLWYILIYSHCPPAYNSRELKASMSQ